MKNAFILGAFITFAVLLTESPNPQPLHLTVQESSDVASYVSTLPPLLPPVGEVGPATTIRATVHGKVTSPESHVAAPVTVPAVSVGILSCEVLSNAEDAHTGNGQPGWYNVILDGSSVLDWSMFRNCEPYHG